MLSRDANAISVSDIVRLYAFEKYDFETMRRAIQVEALPESWRKLFPGSTEKTLGLANRRTPRWSSFAHREASFRLDTTLIRKLVCPGLALREVGVSE